MNKKNHKQRRAAAMWKKAGPNAPQCFVCHAPCIPLDGAIVCLRCERIQPSHHRPVVGESTQAE